MPAHHWISPENGVPDQRLCKERYAKRSAAAMWCFNPEAVQGKRGCCVHSGLVTVEPSLGTE